MTDAELRSLFPELTSIETVLATLPDVRDQGKRPICLAHAVTASHEITGSHGRLSVEYLQYQAWDRQGRLVRNEAVSAPAVQSALENPGQPVESDWVYDALRKVAVTDRAPPVGKCYSKASRLKRPFTTQDIVNAIRSGQAPTLLLQLTTSWHSGDAFISVRRNDSTVGYHAVIAIALGFNSEPRVQIVIQNSWGDLWGRGGYAAVDETYFGSFLKGAIVLD